MGVYCESLSSWECTVRRFSIMALQQGRLAWIALSFVVISYFTRSFPIALLAWGVSCAGLILYSAELCSMALLLAGLVAVSGGERDAANKTGNDIQSQ
jgi:hypothetical protein